MIRRILLDLDDVLNRFTLTALKHVGCPIDTDRYDLYPTEVGYEIIQAANTLVGWEKFGLSDFWNSIPRRLWATVEPSQEMHLLIRMCEELVGRDNIAILTSPTIDPECLAGKGEWVRDHLPKWLHRQVLIGPCKHFCAHPEALLIDDADKNVDKFRAWGGNAILVPRPWNTRHMLDTSKTLVNEFCELFEQQGDRGMKLSA